MAREVGVNIATLHYYFPTKESLIRAVAQYALQRFRTTLAPRGEPGTQLRSYMRATRRLLRDEPELGAVMSELALRSVRDAETRKILDEVYAVWQTTVRGLLRRSAQAGVLREGVDADGAAGLIIAALGSLAVPPSHAKRGAQALRELEKLLLKESIN